jgi:hypothetical protein
MNRRDFFTAVGAASVVSFAGLRPASASVSTNLYLDGLLMISFEDHALRIGFPKAPGHKATLKIVPRTGATNVIKVKGNGVLDSPARGNGRPKVFAPEVVQLSEIYGTGVKAHFDKCPNVIEVPYAAIKSITTSKITKDRWTFVRADNKQEIDSFRPRRIAEGLKLELVSGGTLKLDAGKTQINLDETQDILCNYAPETMDAYPDMYPDHFVHYMQYFDRPPAADFLVLPKKLTGAASGPLPRLGHRFFAGGPFCFVVVVGSMSS